MNLTGAALYSKATRGLKQADVITDQHFKLVFIYPMLFDNKLQGKYGNLMRQFISVSMLKEIFVSNALQMISMASKNQSVEDENGERTDVYSLIGRTIAGRAGQGQMGAIDFRMPPQQTTNKYELQQKIKEKTAVIRKLLASDPRLKSLNPYVEIITLENMIDVPVIVGTSNNSIDTLTMTFVLAASISLKKRLNNWADVQHIFNVIENTKPENAWELFNNLVDDDNKNTKDRLISWIGEDNPRLAAIMQRIGPRIAKTASGIGKYVARKTRTEPLIKGISGAASQVPQKADEYVRSWIPGTGRGQRVDDVSSDEYDPNLPFKSEAGFDILKTVQKDLDQAKLMFKFMLDDNLLRTRFGLDKNPGQMSTAVKKISSQGEALFFQMHQNFMELVGYNANIAFSSFFNSIYPWDTDVDYLETKDKYLDKKMNNVVSDINEELKTLLANTFSTEGVDTNRAKIMKTLCTAGLEQTTGMIEGKTRDLANVRIGSPTFEADQLARFLKVLEETAQQYSSTLEKLKNQLSSVINNSRSYFDKVDTKIDEVVDEMLTSYTNQLTRDASGGFGNIALSRNGVLSPHNDSTGSKTVTYINQGKSYLSVIIQTMYYTSVVDAVCQYVKYLDVEIETVKNDVLDLPNYTLVLPVEVIIMLHSAIMAKTWQNLVSRNQTSTTNLTDNYIKGVVNFISKKIDVPNLIVIDSKRNQVYYKLMYTSLINKSNIRTFETFVQSVQKSELERPNY